MHWSSIPLWKIPPFYMPAPLICKSQFDGIDVILQKINAEWQHIPMSIIVGLRRISMCEVSLAAAPFSDSVRRHAMEPAPRKKSRWTTSYLLHPYQSEGGARNGCVFSLSGGYLPYFQCRLIRCHDGNDGWWWCCRAKITFAIVLGRLWWACAKLGPGFSITRWPSGGDWIRCVFCGP